MNDIEVRMRCIEAAAKLGVGSHALGPAAGVIEMATAWFDWINSVSRPAAGAEPPLEKIAETAAMLY